VWVPLERAEVLRCGELYRGEFALRCCCCCGGRCGGLQNREASKSIPQWFCASVVCSGVCMTTMRSKEFERSAESASLVVVYA
jgi:hypothetical protein